MQYLREVKYVRILYYVRLDACLDRFLQGLIHPAWKISQVLEDVNCYPFAKPLRSLFMPHPTKRLALASGDTEAEPCSMPQQSDSEKDSSCR